MSSAVLFSKQQSVVASGATGMGVAEKSSPNAVVFRNEMYLFYSGSGKDGVWFTTSSDGSIWTSVSSLASKNLMMGIADNTSVSAVVFQNKLYAFWAGRGSAGVWYTVTSDEVSWDAAIAVQPQGSVLPILTASPAAVVFRDQLFLFVADADGGVSFTKSSDGRSWSSIMSLRTLGLTIGIQAKTSPSAIVFQDQLLLFYNGSGKDGIWYAVSRDGSSWNSVQSMRAKDMGMNVKDYTSPNAIVFDERLYLYYVGSGGDGLWLTSTINLQSWTGVSSMRLNMEVPDQGVLSDTSPSAVEFQFKPYYFWHGSGKDGLWYATELDLDVATQAETIIYHALTRKEFLFTLNSTTTQALSSRLRPDSLSLALTQTNDPRALSPTDVAAGDNATNITKSHADANDHSLMTGGIIAVLSSLSFGVVLCYCQYKKLHNARIHIRPY